MSTPTESLKKRREQVLQRMEPDSVLVLIGRPSALRNRDTYYPYRIDSDLYYLIDTNEEELAFILDSTGKCAVYARVIPKSQERWIGIRHSATEIAEHLGLDPKKSARDRAKLFKDLGRWFKNKKVVYWNFANTDTNNALAYQALTEPGITLKKGDSWPTSLIHPKEILHELRLYKDEQELSRIRQAAQISARAHNLAMQFTRRFKQPVTEQALKSFIEAQFFAQGASATAYPSIVAAGANATFLHYEHTKGRANGEELFLIDAGCEYEGYASDITRTFPANGKFSAARKDIYQLVLDAQEAAISKTRPPNTVEDVHQAALDVLIEGLWHMGLFKKVPKEWPLKTRKNKGESLWLKPNSKEEVKEKHIYRLYFMHRTSHYMGIDVHDVGSYYINGHSRPLEPGICLTIEPGLYFPEEYTFIPDEFKGIGVRIEDDVVVTQHEPEVITKDAIKQMKEIEALGPLKSVDDWPLS